MFAVAKQQQQTAANKYAAAAAAPQLQQQHLRNGSSAANAIHSNYNKSSPNRAANAATTTRITQVTALVLFVLHFVIVVVVWVTSSCVTREYARSIRSRRLPSVSASVAVSLTDSASVAALPLDDGDCHFSSSISSRKRNLFWGVFLLCASFA